MDLPSTKPTLLLLISLALCLSSGAQNSPDDYVAAHNAVRAQVGVGPIYWDYELASYAQNYAYYRGGDCNLVHSGGPYGENTAFSTFDDFSGVDAVNMWAQEKQYYDYDYDSNSCAFGEMCDHYTQVVWRSSTALGCARTPCNFGGWYVICSYNPPGNYNGERPY